MSTAKGGPGESIEAFAVLRARLVDPFAERARVLREEGLDERALAAVEATWSARLAAGDAAAEELARAFGEAFSSARAVPGDRSGAARRGGAESGAQPSLAGAFSEVTSAAESAPPVIEATPAAAEPAPAQPTFAQPSYAKPTFTQPTAPQELAAKPAFAQPTYAQQTPPQPMFAQQAPSPPAAAQQAPSPPATAQQPPSPPAATPEYTATAGIDLAAIMKKVVPFDPFAKPSVGAAAGGEEEARPAASRSPEFGGTAEVDIAAIAAAARDRFAKPKGATSGSGPVAPPAAPLAKPATAPPAAPPPVAPTDANKGPAFDETADVDISTIARQVLAFGPRGAPAPASPPSRAPAAATPPPPPAATPPAVVATAPAPSPPPAMSLDQYALLSAEIAIVGTDPAGRGAVFRRVGVDNPEALMAEWRARFAADPALAGRWSAAYAHHYARLRTERGGGR